MAKNYKVLVNEGSGAETKFVNVLQGVGDKGTPVRIVAQRGVRYELQDELKGKGLGPDQVRVKRSGKNLTLIFDGSQKPDVVVEDFYAVGSAEDGSVPVLAGLAENGGVYEYIPQDPALGSVTPALADGNTPVLMALGGGALGDGFVLSALPLVAAAGGISGWAIAGGVAGAAALAGGGGGGGGATADTTAPGMVKLALPEAAGGGVNATEAADGTPLNVVLPADAVVGDTVTTVLTKPDGSKQTLTHVLTAADVAAKSITQNISVADLKDKNGNYIDGTWVLTTTVTDAAKNVSTPVQSTFVLDTSAPEVASISGNLKHDEANDTGAKVDDSITSNSTPMLVVKAETGATVDVVVNGKTYRATESTTNKGEYEVTGLVKLDDATYTPSIAVTDAAGNKTTKDGVAFTVDTSAATNPANGNSTDKKPADQNTGATTAIAITAVSEDSGSSNTDFITTDKSVLISGTVTNFYNAGASVGDAVHVQIFDANGKRVAHAYATPLANGSSTWAMTAPTADLVDGDYIIKADIVDAAGNAVKSAAAQPLKISADYLFTVNDVAEVQEGGLNVPTQNKSGNVLTNDVIATSAGVSVVEVKFGANAATPIVPIASPSAATKISGLYGDLFISPDGSYEYKVDDVKAQHLSASAKPTEIFTYFAKNASDAVRSAILTVTVNGANDAASFDANSTTTGTVSIGSTGSVNGDLKVSDPDDGESTFSTPSSLKGTYGDFTFEGATGKWQYKLNTSATLAHNASGHDDLVVESYDRTASKTVTVTVTGENSAPLIDDKLNVSIGSVDGNQQAPANGSLPAGTTKVSSLIAGGMTDVNNDALGIAITQVDITHGSLYYTQDNGANWTNLKEASTTKALLLSANDNTRVYYQQTSAGVEGAFTFVAWDHTAPQSGLTADVSNRGGTTAFSDREQKVVVDDVFYTTGSPINFVGGTGFDTLILKGSGLTLDLSNATLTQPLSGIEKIDITGQGDNTITLNLASVTQADVIGSVHTLFITGDNGDAVNLVKPQNWAVESSLPTQTVNNIAYNVYHLDNTNDLLIQQAITNVMFS